MINNLIYKFGYLGIFCVCLFANTPLPLSPDLFIGLMIHLDYNIWLLSIVCATGGLIGSYISYFFGKYGKRFFLSKYMSSESKYMKKANKFYAKYGTIVLFFSWLPILGDLFCMVAGTLNYNLKRYSIIVFIGKFIRFIVLCFILAKII